jgi:NodT family efflux transporter outer membrane factor (OMF) lipoprotein
VRPSTTVPTKFKEAKGKAFVVKNNITWKTAKPQDEADRGAWWHVFHDSQLNRLEDQLNSYNQTIVNAMANYYQACAIVDEARASYYPILSAAGSIFRQTGGGATSFISSTPTGTSTGVASGSGGARSGIISTNYTAFLNANWEPDIWGLVKRTVESDLSAAQSSKALLAATRLSAQGALAQYYFELRTLDRDQQLLDNTVISYRKALQLTINQYKSGVASRSDIVQAQSQLETAQAQAVNNGILRGQYEHAIAVLMGRPPADFKLSFSPLNAKPPVIPVMIPTELLERRPDIAQAERMMQQANALIGVAVAAYFPTLNLSASISASGSTITNLTRAPALGWSYGAQLVETIYDGGLRNATVRAAKAGYMANVASYRQTVLAAFQDVEDNLTSSRILREQIVFQNQAAASANKTLQLIINQYKAGTVAYSNVITAQIAAYTAQKAANDVAGLQMTAAVGLIKALGGGWNAG